MGVGFRDVKLCSFGILPADTHEKVVADHQSAVTNKLGCQVMRITPNRISINQSIGGSQEDGSVKHGSDGWRGRSQHLIVGDRDRRGRRRIVSVRIAMAVLSVPKPTNPVAPPDTAEPLIEIRCCRR